jgi:Zn finger protein HypA/HybF involved in hydrogenase expression
MLERFKNGCVDCGNDDVRVLQFDHLKDKKIAVSELLKLGASSKKVVEELDKCDVVCANCHSIRTSSRAYDWRSKIHTSVYPLATNESEG